MGTIKKKYIWIALGIIILVPIGLNCLILLPAFFPFVGDDKMWISFWGGYIGSVLMGIITLMVLHKQLKQNHDENEKNRSLQLSVLKYNQSLNVLRDLRSALVNFQISFNYIEINRVIGKMINGDYNRDDYYSLNNLVRDIEEKNFIVDTIIKDIAASKALCKYNLLFNKLYNSYGHLIGDIIFFFDLIDGLPDEKEKIRKYVENELNNSDYIDDTQLNISEIPNINKPKTISQIIKDYSDYSNIESNAPEILKKRLIQTINESDLTEQLKDITIEILKDEQSRIDSLLIKEEK